MPPLATCIDQIPFVGTKLYIGAALPASYDEAGYDAVSWSEVGMVESMSEFGPETEVNAFSPVGTGVDCQTPGKTNNGVFDFVVANTEADTGLAAVVAHFAAKTNLPYKIETPESGVVENHRFYFSGLCTRNRNVPGSVGDPWKKSIAIAINTDVLEFDAKDV